MYHAPLGPCHYYRGGTPALTQAIYLSGSNSRDNGWLEKLFFHTTGRHKKCSVLPVNTDDLKALAMAMAMKL